MNLFILACIHSITNRFIQSYFSLLVIKL